MYLITERITKTLALPELSLFSNDKVMLLFSDVDPGVPGVQAPHSSFESPKLTFLGPCLNFFSFLPHICQHIM